MYITGQKSCRLKALFAEAIGVIFYVYLSFLLGENEQNQPEVIYDLLPVIVHSLVN